MNRKPGDWNCPSCDHLNFSWRESCQRCSDPKQVNNGCYDGRNEDRRSDEAGDYGRRSGRSSYGFGSSYSSGRGRGGGGGLERGAYGGSGGGFYDRNSAGKDDYRGSDYGSTRGYGDRASDYRSNEYSSRGSYGGGSDMRPGDWHCVEKSCGAHNFASRTNCFKCGAAKEDKEEAVDGRGRGRGGGYDSGWSAGSYERGLSRGGGSYYDQGNVGGSGRAGWKSGDWMCTRPGCNEHNFASRVECFRCQSRRED